MQRKCGALLFGERGAFVEFRVKQQVIAGKVSANDGRFGAEYRIIGHAMFSSGDMLQG